VGIVRVTKGEFPQAIPWLERGVAICQTRQVPLLLSLIAAELIHAYAGSGRLAEGSRLLAQALVPMAASHSALVLLSRSEAYLLAGEHDEATRRAKEALEAARRHRQWGQEAYALRILGDTASHPDAPAVGQALGHYRQALALAQELGMRPLVAHCHLGLGTLYQKLGRETEAQTELVTAEEMYRAMDMPFWLARAEAALA
jgi:tetratricopeptide (TPR) repeat protein